MSRGGSLHDRRECPHHLPTVRAALRSCASASPLRVRRQTAAASGRRPRARRSATRPDEPRGKKPSACVVEPPGFLPIFDSASNRKPRPSLQDATIWDRRHCLSEEGPHLHISWRWAPTRCRLGPVTEVDGRECSGSRGRPVTLRCERGVSGTRRRRRGAAAFPSRSAEPLSHPSPALSGSTPLPRSASTAPPTGPT